MSRKKDLTVTKVEAMVLRYQYEKGIADAQNFFSARSAVIVQVHTACGITGIGESASFGGPAETTKYIIEHELAPIVIGEDASSVSRIWQKMFDRTRQHGRSGVIMAAMSGIDIALWDVVGKHADLPVYKLFGGYTDKVVPYASSGFYSPGKTASDTAEECRSYFKRGFKYAKIKIGRNPEMLLTPLHNMAYAEECQYSVEEDLARVEACCNVAKEYGARIMVDDAHGLGTIGEGGRGTASYYGLEKEVDIYMGTFSKSLASLGGYMAAEAKVADYVRCNSRPYIFSASVPPACIAVATASLRHLKANPDLPKHLQELSLYMQSELKKRDVKFKETQVPIIPIYTYETLRTLKVQKALYERGLYVNASVPPATAPNEALLRVSLMATHTKEQIDEAVEIIAETLKEF